MKKINTKYTKINTSEPRHSENPNPVRTVRLLI